MAPIGQPSTPRFVTATLVATGGLWACRHELHFAVPESSAGNKEAGRLSHALASGPVGMWPLMAEPAPLEVTAIADQPIFGSEGLAKPCFAAAITAVLLGAARRGARRGRRHGRTAALARRTGQWWQGPGMWWQGLVEAKDGAVAMATNAVEAMSTAPGNAAKAFEAGAGTLSAGLQNLQAAPAELGARLLQPVPGTTSAGGAAQTVPGHVAGAAAAVARAEGAEQATAEVHSPARMAATAFQNMAAVADMAGGTVRAMRGSTAVWGLPHSALEAARGGAEAPSRPASEPQDGTMTAVDTVRGWFAAAGSAFAALGQLGANLRSVGAGLQGEPRPAPVAVAGGQGKMGTTAATGARTPKERSPRDRALAALRAAISVAEDAGVDVAELETACAVAGMPAAAAPRAPGSQQDDEAARARARAIALARIEQAVAEESVQRAAREEEAVREAVEAQCQVRSARAEPALPRVLRVQAQPMRAMASAAAAAKKPAVALRQDRAGGVQDLLMQHASAQDAVREITRCEEQQQLAEATTDVAQEGARERYLRAKAVFQA
mmetsp:Transcript_15631/g.49427  ORF Transcript_15631/g.49427 Transcript_15631/m.49427 type:complete len:552 (+) Transcript_15631:102-1757(+)